MTSFDLLVIAMRGEVAEVASGGSLLDSIPAPILWALVVFAGLFGLVLFFAFAKYGNLWVQAFSSGASVGIFDLIGMHLRKVKPAQFV
ncbi:MAG: hypothetical protein AAGA30_20725, partial [Planctomycetota bacterium]